MLALVDGVPRTLRARRVRAATTSPTRSRSSSGAPVTGCARPRSARTSCAGCVKALDQLDAVIALIRSSPSRRRGARRADAAARHRRDPGHGDPRHAAAPAGRPGAAADHRRARRARAADRRAQGDPGQRAAAARRSSARSWREIVEKYGDERRTQIIAGRRRHVHGGPDRRGGRRRHHHPRRLRQAHQDRPLPLAAARRQGRARRGAARATTSSSTSSSPRPTTGSCSSPTRAGSTAPRRTSCPRQARDARGQHVANLLAFQPDEQIAAGAATCATTTQAPYLVLATTRRPGQEDPARPSTTPTAAGGVIAINLREDDELIARRLVGRRRRPAAGQPQGPVGPVHTPTTTRCGRWAGRRPGVIGMRFRGGDELLAMDVVRDRTPFVLTVDRRRLRQAHPAGRRGPRRAAAASGVIAMRSSRTAGPWSVPWWSTRATRCMAVTAGRRRHPHPDHRGRAAVHEPGHDGCALDEPRRG